MKNTIFTKTIVILLFVFAMSFAATAQTQGSPVTKTRLTGALQVKSISTEQIVSIILKNGVDFALTNADEVELRKLGADDNLIKAVKENYRGKESQADNLQPINSQKSEGMIGKRVNVKFRSIINEATILEASGGKYKVHYEDTMAEDEWVEADRVIPFDFGNTAGGPPAGTYVCYMPMYENSYMGTFIVSANGNYQYQTGNKGSGKFKYNAQNNTIEWVSGDLAGKGVTGEYFNLKENGPNIVLIFPKGKRQGDIQNCLKKD